MILLAIAALMACEMALRRIWKAHRGKQLDARSVALRDASRGAAMIVLAFLALLHFGRFLPAWFHLVALAVVIWGSLRLYNGAKFSAGWRDPQHIASALVKTSVGIAVYVLADAQAPAEFLSATAPYGQWAVKAVVVWCVVTGMTKLLLVLRGHPAMLPVDPGMPHGTAGFSNPDDPEFKL